MEMTSLAVLFNDETMQLSFSFLIAPPGVPLLIKCRRRLCLLNQLDRLLMLTVNVC